MTTPPATGTACASTEYSISAVASTIPNGKTANPKRLHTTKYPKTSKQGETSEARFALRANCLTIAPQHRHVRRQHHRCHHHDPHREEQSSGLDPSLSGHPHPHHRHRPAARHRHPSHVRHGCAPEYCQRGAGGEQRGGDADEGTIGPSFRCHLRLHAAADTEL